MRPLWVALLRLLSGVGVAVDDGFVGWGECGMGLRGGSAKEVWP